MNPPDVLYLEVLWIPSVEFHAYSPGPGFCELRLFTRFALPFVPNEYPAADLAVELYCRPNADGVP